jgi:hypothetical protein
MKSLKTFPTILIGEKKELSKESKIRVLVDHAGLSQLLVP